MFLLVDQGLSKGLASAQAGHALAQFAMDHPEKFRDWNNGYLIVMKADLKELRLVTFDMAASNGIFRKN